MEQFQNDIKNGFVIADFWAPWCGDCRRIEPILAELEQDFKIIRVNIDERTNLYQDYEIMRIPTLIFFQDGAEVGNRIVEPKSKAEILEAINLTKGAK